MSDTQKPVEPVPHIDILKQDNGFFAVVHALEPYSPQLVTAPTLDDMHRTLVSVLVSEFHISPDRAAQHVASGDVRHVEDTIMAAHQRGVLGMSKQLQDANKALAAAKAELEALKAEKAAAKVAAKAEPPKQSDKSNA
jgi:hypothetical protein